MSKKVEIERYFYRDYIMEVEEFTNKWGETQFDFWLQKENYGVKSYMFGWLADQTKATIDPHVYTRSEAIALALCNIDDYIDIYREEYEESDDDVEVDNDGVYAEFYAERNWDC